MSGESFFVFVCAVVSFILSAVFFLMAEGNEALLMESVAFLVVGIILILISLFVSARETVGILG